VPSDRYSIQCVLDLASCEIVTVRTPAIINLHLLLSMFAAAPLGNFTITVYIRQAAAHLNTCEANYASPRNAAVLLINLYHLLI